MPTQWTKEQKEKRRQEEAEIGKKDAKRLHEGMNESENSEEKRAHKQPDHATGKRPDK